LNAITTAPTSSLGYVTNDGTSANNGLYQWNGTVWTKSIYDPLTQAKGYADNLSANNVIKVADAILADPSENLYNTTNDIANFYISDQSSQYAGRINALNGTAIHSMGVKVGETYLFYAPTLTGMLAVAFSKEDSVISMKQLTLADMTTVSSSIKKVVVPAGMNYLFFNTKIPSLSFDVTASLVVNKFKSSFIGYGEAVVADEKAREAIAILETAAVMNSDIASPNYFPNLAIDEISGVYISAVGSVSGVGKFASYVNSAIQRISVEAGKIYAIYSDNFNNTLFTVTASDSPLTTLGKQNTVLSLSDTSDPKVKTFIVPEAMSFVFMTVYIQSLNFDMRSIIWVNEGQNSTKDVVPSVTGIKGFQIRDPLAQERLDDFNIVHSSVLKDKKWIAIGDSITEKNIRANINYHDYIKQDVGGMTVYNKGISGSGFHDRMNVADTLTEQADYITILWGTNDFGLVRNTYPLGTFLSTDTETISGRINTCLNALITKYPLAKIAIISALPCLTNYGSNAAPNSVGYTLKQHVDLLKQYAAHYSLPFLNLYEQSNLPVWIPAANQHYFTAPTLTTPDGLHPNDAGQRVMADKIKAFLESI